MNIIDIVSIALLMIFMVGFLLSSGNLFSIDKVGGFWCLVVGLVLLFLVCLGVMVSLERKYEKAIPNLKEIMIEYNYEQDILGLEA